MAIDPERHDRIVAMMREEKLDALICSFPTKVLLLTGNWPVIGTSVAIFTAEGEVHVLVRGDEQEIAEKSSSAVITAFSPAELYSLTTPQEAIAKPLIALCAKLSLTCATIGIEREPGIQPASYAVTASYRSALVDLLRREFLQIEIRAADTALERLNAGKTMVELEKRRVTVSFAATGFDAMTDANRPGLREAEIAGLIQMAFERTTLAAQMQRSYGFFTACPDRTPPPPPLAMPEPDRDKCSQGIL